MTMLNSASDGDPAVWRSLLWTLACAPGGTMPKPCLSALMAPSTVPLREGGGFFRSSILRATELGLVQSTDDTVALSAAHSSMEPGDVQAFRVRMRRSVFDPTYAEPFFDEEKRRGVSADLLRALAWFLAVDGCVSGASWAAAESRLRETMRPDRPHTPQGQVRWNAFRAWATLLGFGWDAGSGRVKAFVPDPAVAIRDELPEIFGNKQALTQKEFRDSLALHLPVLDGGTYRNRMEAALMPAAVRREHPRQFSASTTRALRRLRALGVLRWDRRSDTDLAFLGAPSTPGSESASHFILKEAVDA